MSTITEIKTTLGGRVETFACDLAERTAGRLVVLYQLPQAREVHGVWLPPGALTIGYFWRHRPYNLYHWVTAGGQTLAYYFNIGEIVRWEPEVLEWRDLVVDVLATPDGRVTVLDEDELPPDLDQATRQRIEAARDSVLRDLGQLAAEAEQESRRLLRRH